MRFLFLVSLFSVLSIQAQIVVFKEINEPIFSEMVVFDHTHSDSVKKFEKLELGLKLKPEIQARIYAFVKKQTPLDQNYPINPFVSWDLRVVTTFKHLESGETNTIDGFFFENYRQDERSNAWKQLNENYKFRTRFSPNKTGKWTAELNVFLRGTKVQTNTGFSFAVVDSNLPGFVSVNKNNKNFERDNKVFTPVGANLPWPMIRSNTEYSYKKGQQVHMSVWRTYHNDLKKYTALDGDNKVVRLFLTESSSHIEFEEVGNYYDRLNYAWEMDKVIEQCEKTNTLVDFNLQLHTPIMKFANYHYIIYDFAKSYKNDEFPISGFAKYLNSNTPSDMFMLEKSMKYIKEKHRYIIARWGYSTAILMFELLSEPWHINEDAKLDEQNRITKTYVPYDLPEGDLERKAITKFHKEISNYIKDSLNHKKHLIGAIGHLPYNQNSVYSPVAENVKVQDSSWALKNIDVICISTYNSSTDKYLISKSSNNDLTFDKNENSVAHRVNNLQEFYKKPVYFSEFGNGELQDLCSNLNASKIDLIKAGFTGIAGFNAWFSYYYGTDRITDDRNIWPVIVDLHNFHNARITRDIVSDSDWIQGREKKSIRSGTDQAKDASLKELQYIISQDKNKLKGYVHNKSFNIGNALKGLDVPTSDEEYCQQLNPAYKVAIPLEWENGKLTLQGVERRTRYKFDFYSYQNTTLVNSICMKSNLFGKIKLKHPTLGTTISEHPLYLFTAIKSEACKENKD